jgi:carbonic anhydrase
VHRNVRLLTSAAICLAIAFGYAASGRFGPSRAALADRPPTAAAQEKQALSSEQAWQRLKEGNDRFAADRLENKAVGAERRRELADGQRPFAVVLTCADSRLAPEFIFNQGLGDLFVLRVAGNIADPFVLGSIEYAVEHLHVPLIVVLGHEKCGAVEAALRKEKPTGNLGKLLGEIDVGKDLPAGKAVALAAAVNNNVRHHTRLLTERSGVIKAHVAKTEVRIISGVYRLATGKVEWLEEK